LVSTGLEGLDQLLGGGYPEKSAVLLVGPPGIGKEAIGYLFANLGVVQGDLSLYITRLAKSEVLQDMKAFGINNVDSLVWVSKEGGEMKCDLNDLAGLSYGVKEVLRKKSSGRKVRVVSDILSPVLMLNSKETVYRFLSQLVDDIKQQDAVVLATIEEGMHDPQVIAAMGQLFDGVLELKLYSEGLRLVPLLRVAKMRGVPPQPGYYNLSFADGRMEIQAHVK
jgi:circadian clock protein KaiC